MTKSIRLIATVLAVMTFGPTAVAHAAGPEADTDDASLVTDTSARLNGEVDPKGDPTTVWFEYGATTGYGSQSGTRVFSTKTTVFHALTGLTPGTVYHFRLRALDTHGHAAAGTDHAFTTTGTAPTAPAPAPPRPPPPRPRSPARPLRRC